MTTAHRPIAHPAAWSGPDLARDGRWILPLSDEQVRDLERATDGVVRAGLPFSRIDRATFPLPAWGALLATVRTEVADGRGFVLLRGAPVEGRPVAWLEKLFWGLGAHLGTGVTQTAKGDLISHVTDLGPVEGLKRGFQTNREARLHIDLADGVGLLCLRQAKAGGLSMLASSVTAYNVLCRERPEVLDVLFRGFPWDRRDEHAPGEAPIGPRVPVFSLKAGRFSCRYNRSFIDTVARRTGVPLSTEETAALDALDAVIQRDDLALPMDFRPGDIQLVSNHTVLHARTAYEDHPEPDRRRHLLRLWWLIDGLGPFEDEDAVRFGTLRYGNLGLTAAAWEARA